MRLSSGFLLLETHPGHETLVLDQLARVAGVTHRNVIFPAAIAVRLEAKSSVEGLAAQLRALEGVVHTRFYRTRHT